MEIMVSRNLILLIGFAILASFYGGYYIEARQARANAEAEQNNLAIVRIANYVETTNRIAAGNLDGAQRMLDVDAQISAVWLMRGDKSISGDPEFTRRRKLILTRLLKIWEQKGYFSGNGAVDGEAKELAAERDKLRADLHRYLTEQAASN
jgi:hypothetical protein